MNTCIILYQTTHLSWGKTLESPLDSKKIKPGSPQGNQPWIFIGRTDAEASVLWPTGVKSRLTGEDWGGRGDGWIAWPTQGTRVWANSEREWRTGRPGVLPSGYVRPVFLDHALWDSTCPHTPGLPIAYHLCPVVSLAFALCPLPVACSLHSESMRCGAHVPCSQRALCLSCAPCIPGACALGLTCPLPSMLSASNQCLVLPDGVCYGVTCHLLSACGIICELAKSLALCLQLSILRESRLSVVLWGHAVSLRPSLRCKNKADACLFPQSGWRPQASVVSWDQLPLVGIWCPPLASGMRPAEVCRPSEPRGRPTRTSLWRGLFGHGLGCLS